MRWVSSGVAKAMTTRRSGASCLRVRIPVLPMHRRNRPCTHQAGVESVSEPHIETERLILRLPRIEDFEGYAELHADEEAARHIGGALLRAPAWRKFLQMPGAWAVQGYAMFSVVEKASGRWL